MNCDNWDLFEDYQNTKCQEEEEDYNKEEHKMQLKNILKLSLGLGIPGVILIIFGYLVYKHADLRQYLKLKVTQNVTRLRSVFSRIESPVSDAISEMEYDSIGTIMENSWPLRDVTQTIQPRRWGGYLPERDTVLYPRVNEIQPEETEPEVSESEIWSPPFHEQTIPDFYEPIWNPPFRAHDLSFGTSFKSDTMEMEKTDHDTVSIICETPRRPRRQARDKLNKKFDEYVLY